MVIDPTAAARGEFKSEWYMRHNRRRQEHLASLDLDLVGKAVLEVGAGGGDHTGCFLDRGCTVTCVEPRRENCALLLATLKEARYDLSRVTVVESDIEGLSAHLRGSFEIVYCYGLLYHIADPLSALRTMADHCRDLLLLETVVSQEEGEAVNVTAEIRQQSSQAFYGEGARPTREWVWRRLRELFPHIYVPRTQPAHPEFPLDWSRPNDLAAFSRAIFVASRRLLSNPRLSDAILARQERA